MPAINSLTLAAARQIIFAAETKAYQLASPSAISVIDRSGQLIAHIRMEGARIGRANPSLNKALNALAIGLCLGLDSRSAEFASTGLSVRREKGELPTELETNVIARLKIESGAIALHQDGEIRGAIGVSSAKPENDQEIALAASDAFSCGITVSRRSLRTTAGLSVASVHSLFPSGGSEGIA